MRYSLHKFFESMYYVFLCCQPTRVVGLVQIHTDESSYIFSPQDGTEYTDQYCSLLWMVGLIWGWIKVGLHHLILHTLYWSYQVHRATASDTDVPGCDTNV
jgi:hypothetical protein